MATETENLILEHLRILRAEIGHLRDDMSEIKRGLIRVRNDLHELRGDSLRLEKRLRLVDA